MSHQDNTKLILDILMSLHHIEESLLDISEKEKKGSAEKIEAQLDYQDFGEEPKPPLSLQDVMVSLDNIEDTIRCILLDKGFSSAAAIAQYQQYIYPKKD